MLLLHAADLPCSLALASAGNSNPARIAIMAITTSSSISVNAAVPDTPSRSCLIEELVLHITGHPLLWPSGWNVAGADPLFVTPGYAATVRLTAHLPEILRVQVQRSNRRAAAICGWWRAPEAKGHLCCQ